MITGKDINPSREIYYLGGVVIQLLKKSQNTSQDFFDVLQRLNEKEKVSVNLFTLILDWLFLLRLVEVKNGSIIKCF